MAGEFQYIIFPAEAEAFVEFLSDLDYDCYGKEQWYKQHSYLDKLNMQAVASARSGSDEFVKEFIISHQKVGFLIRDLVATELWHRKIFKRLMNCLPENLPTFPLYVALYHELVLANILETVTYHTDVVDCLNDDAVDLCDWCHRALCRLANAVSIKEKKANIRTLKDQSKPSETNKEELQRQTDIFTYEVGMKAISLTRHLIEHCCGVCTDTVVSSATMALSMARRLLHTHDFLCLLCHLIELAPWGCEEATTSMRPLRYQWHESGCWVSETDEKNWSSVTKSEGQVWLSIHQLLFSGVMGAVSYEVVGSSVRRQALLRLRPFLTEALIDVIPVLGHLRRFLEEFAVSEAAAVARSVSAVSSAAAVAQLCHIEDIPQIHDGILHRYKGRWDDEASDFLQRIQLKENAEAAQRAASRWAEAFSEETVDALFGSTGSGNANGHGDSEAVFEHPLLRTPRCVICGEVATKRCSRCRHEWYCRRQCQVEHWPRHKRACDMLFASNTD
ncbi:zinc finger MYND domain containing protein [Echinococcus multilocularis]|uniref:Zinc finger MYND domain containing protein n=1 Tax=Echinococcus multilocularis TaxID=6211 RepID=A0A068Y5E7_ECHMU|nr:zinc finger MYND domain containing protein [Echinococcus multilocularis]